MLNCPTLEACARSMYDASQNRSKSRKCSTLMAAVTYSVKKRLSMSLFIAQPAAGCSWLPYTHVLRFWTTVAITLRPLSPALIPSPGAQLPDANNEISHDDQYLLVGWLGRAQQSRSERFCLTAQLYPPRPCSRMAR